MEPQTLYASKTRKKAANVSINADLLKSAKAFGINLSATLEQALADQIRAKQREQWVRENGPAIDAYHQDVAEHGVFGDAARDF